MILNGLRPVLRETAGIERVSTPLRLFCLPFEDLLSDTPRREKLPGRIARSSVAPVFRWLSTELVPSETAAFVAEATTLIEARRDSAAFARAAEFWKISSDAMLTALPSESGRPAVRAILGSAEATADAREMALLLSVGPAISDFRSRLPRPAPDFTEDYLRLARATYNDLVATAPDAAPYVAVVAMGRLAQPWQALRLPLSITRQSQDTLISGTDIGLVGELLFADLEEHARIIRAARQPLFDADVLIARIGAFAKLSDGMVREIEMRRGGRWGQRLLKDRAALAEVMDGFMKRAPKEILGALPTIRTGAYAGGPRGPDLARALDPEIADRARRYAKLLAGCRDFAAAASFGASLADAQDEVTSAIRNYAGDILRELRASQGARRQHAEQFFDLTAQLMEMLISPEEAEFLRRRGRAAAGATAAA
jgi:hypothetical protein